MILEMVTIKDALSWSTERLKPVFPNTAEIEARAIISGVLGCSPTHLYLNLLIDLPESMPELINSLVERRLKFEPVAYLLQKKNFMGRDFYVDSRVLIPRPETEFLVETALDFLPKTPSSLRILDVGTGSGCIGLSLALMRPQSDVVCVDISPEALSVAQRNGHDLKVKNVQFFESNLTSGLPAEMKGDFDMIISNPPYISSSEYLCLDPDLGFEPRLALEGGETGLSVIEPLVTQSLSFLKPEGVLMMEIGYQQGRDVRHVLQGFGFQDVAVIKDFLGQDRIIKGVFRGPI